MTVTGGGISNSVFSIFDAAHIPAIMPLALLSSCTHVVNRGCVGQVPEIVDGDAPHALRGCGAQAWGVTEAYRVLALLRRQP